VLACRRPCIAVPIAGDQAHRIACCVNAGIAIGAPLDANALEIEALARLENKQWHSDLQQRFDQCEIRNDMDAALDALAQLTTR
jgi:hypothetical protein